MRKVLMFLLVVVATFSLVGCFSSPVVPGEDEDIPLVPLEPSTPKEDEEEKKKMLLTLLFLKKWLVKIRYCQQVQVK